MAFPRRLLTWLCSPNWADAVLGDVPFHPREIWRESDRSGRVVLMATSSVLAVADPVKLSEARRLDGERIAELHADIARRGFVGWMEVVVDDRSHLTLRDGHHRLCVALDLELPRVPVLFTSSERIPGFRRPLQEVIAELVAPA